MVGTGMPDRDLPVVEANPQNRDRASKAGAGGAQRSHGRQIGNHSSMQSLAFWTVSGPTKIKKSRMHNTEPSFLATVSKLCFNGHTWGKGWL